MKINAGEKHRHLVSLPPKEAQILINDAAAHQKHKESLFSKEKAHVLKINSREQQKHRVSLPPEKKAQLLHTDAAAHQTQHHQLMTEKEKEIAVQIKSFAPTLYEKIDLDQPTIKFLWDHFYKDPKLVLAYYNCCSIDPRAAILNDEFGSDVETSVM